MSWIFFATIALLLWAFANIVDRYIASRELHDPILITTLFGFCVYLIFIVMSLFGGHPGVPFSIIVWAFVAGLAYTSACYLYYKVLSREEISKLAPTMSMEPIVVAFFAFFVFQEHLKLLSYLGIIMIVAGAILMNYKKHSKLSARRLQLWAVISVVLFAAKNLIFKYTTIEAPLLSVLFWFGLGGLMVSLCLYAKHHPHLRRQDRKGLRFIALSALLSALALLFYVESLNRGPVTLVSAFVATKPLAVLILALLISRWHPMVLQEKFDRQSILKKVSATVIIVLGATLVVL